MAIPTLTSPPVVPNKYGGDTTTFNTAMQNRMNWQEVETAEKQQLATWLNTRNTSVEGAYDQAIQLGTLVSTANAAAVSAKASSDAAINTWNAVSTSVVLPSTTGDIHLGAVVKSIIYDTSKDSDGGAWRKRCTDKSWYNETIYQSSTWVGQQASVSAAWALGGLAMFQASATTGPITAGKFYIATSSTGVTEVFRGITREFPALVAIVVEVSRLVIYDLTVSSCPMWISFRSDGANSGAMNFDQSTGSNANYITSVAALNGTVYATQSNSGNGQGLRVINFITDIADRVSDATHLNTWRFNSILSNRNTGFGGRQYSSVGIVNLAANDVAVTVLDTAPIDPATGLPVPTIAVATASGLSVIQNDGTVSSDTQAVNTLGVSIVGNDLYSVVSSSIGYTAARRNFGTVTGSAADKFGLSTGGDALYRHNTIPALYATATNSQVVKAVRYVYGRDTGLTLLKEHPATPTKGMVSYITNVYNSGWLPGDIRGAYLADTTAETITASGELVTNGTFTTDTSGWTATNATFVSATGVAVLTNSGATNGYAYQTITTVVGKAYSVGVSLTLGTATTPRLLIGNSADAVTLGSVSMASTGNYAVNFIATATTTYITVETNSTTISQTASFDNISVKLADPDRSVKNTGLVINGTLTKTAVATGAGLVAYSGFSASNYLEQPYSANLDFGTGDFCVMGWLNVSIIGTSSSLINRALAGSTGGIWCYLNSTGALSLYASADTTNTLICITPTTPIVAGVWNFLEYGRVSGVAYIKVNGVQLVSAALTTNLSYANTVTRFGGGITGLNLATYCSMALWRISATAPSADQIAHIYRTELPLFQASAQCTIAGTSTAVTALAYDDIADTLQVGTSWGRTAFRDLLRVDSEVTTVGTITSLSANEGAVLQGGATKAKNYQPSILLKDELKKKFQAMKALGGLDRTFEYTAIASQTAFILPKGWTIKFLTKNGVGIRESTTGSYFTRSNDGFQETATLSTACTAGDWISITCERVK
jgi:trimeric autotransporter adhesin